MWADAETDVDYLNYSEVAELVTELIGDADLLPLSLGVFGGWGTGKSSTLKLVEAELLKQAKPPLIVKFDAWLYQDFDDARAALMSVIASALFDASPPTLKQKAASLIGRVNKLRLLGFAIEAGAFAMGVPTFGIASKALEAVGDAVKSKADASDVEAVKSGVKDVQERGKGLLRPAEERAPPEEIDAFRKEFGELLKGMDRPLVVFIDNLDRCLPENAIHTLEAVRLFLFIPGTAFVIAADEDMIRHAVLQHFKNPGERHVSDYLDKLIQLPVRVPRAGVQEVRAYLFMLLSRRAGVGAKELEKLRVELIEKLRLSWQDGEAFIWPGIAEASAKRSRRCLEGVVGAAMTTLTFHLSPDGVPATCPPDEIHVYLFGPRPVRKGTGSIGNQAKDEMLRLGVAPRRLATDLLAIALAVTAADTFVKRETAVNSWSRRLNIVLPLADPQPWNDVRSDLKRTLDFLSGDDWSFTFIPGGRPPPTQFEINTKLRHIDLSKIDCVSLFSGGLDSGIATIQMIKGKVRPLLVSHAYTGDASYQEAVWGLLPDRPQRFSLNAHPERIGPHEESMRSRSFNFLAFGILAADTLSTIRSNALIDLYVPENGLIALNAPLTPRRIGALSTRTTHPYFLSSIQQILDRVGLRVRVSNPFELMTKGEMVAQVAGEPSITAFASATVSCGKWKRVPERSPPHETRAGGRRMAATGRSLRP